MNKDVKLPRMVNKLVRADEAEKQAKAEKAVALEYLKQVADRHFPDGHATFTSKDHEVKLLMVVTPSKIDVAKLVASLGCLDELIVRAEQLGMAIPTKAETVSRRTMIVK